MLMFFDGFPGLRQNKRFTHPILRNGRNQIAEERPPVNLFQVLVRRNPECSEPADLRECSAIHDPVIDPEVSLSTVQRVNRNEDLFEGPRIVRVLHSNKKSIHDFNDVSRGGWPVRRST